MLSENGSPLKVLSSSIYIRHIIIVGHLLYSISVYVFFNITSILHIHRNY